MVNQLHTFGRVSRRGKWAGPRQTMSPWSSSWRWRQEDREASPSPSSELRCPIHPDYFWTWPRFFPVGIPTALFSEIHVTDHGMVRWCDNVFFDAFYPTTPGSFSFSYHHHAIQGWRTTTATRLCESRNSFCCEKACPSCQSAHETRLWTLSGGVGNRLACYLCISCV